MKDAHRQQALCFEVNKWRIRVGRVRPQPRPQQLARRGLKRLEPLDLSRNPVPGTHATAVEAHIPCLTHIDAGHKALVTVN